MNNLPRKHFIQLRQTALKANPDIVFTWMLENGFLPEPYVLPPCFVTSIKNRPASACFKVKRKTNGIEYKVSISTFESISFPKSDFSVRAFSTIHPKHYHDIARIITENWTEMIEGLFSLKKRVYSYSFPIPIDKKSPNTITRIRPQRMIYEFLEMAESDLVGEAYKFKYIVKSDISNFYPSVYTHSIAWAIHGKEVARADKVYGLFGNCIDKLLQYANDTCTNGIAIGPVISDFIAELILSAVDAKLSSYIVSEKVDCLCVRFKDDYRILCQSKDAGKSILTKLQSALREYNLVMNESKTEIRELPEGLFRPWTQEYSSIKLHRNMPIKYKTFEKAILEVLRIDEKHPGTGAIDRFLSQLKNYDNSTRLNLVDKGKIKAFSLLMLLKQRRPKAFPSILATIESMCACDEAFSAYVKAEFEKLYNAIGDNEERDYDKLWLAYYLRSKYNVKPRSSGNNAYLKCVVSNKQEIYNDQDLLSVFKKIPKKTEDYHLWKHLDIFPHEARKEEGVT